MKTLLCALEVAAPRQDNVQLDIQSKTTRGSHIFRRGALSPSKMTRLLVTRRIPSMIFPLHSPMPDRIDKAPLSLGKYPSRSRIISPSSAILSKPGTLDCGAKQFSGIGSWCHQKTPRSSMTVTSKPRNLACRHPAAARKVRVWPARRREESPSRPAHICHHAQADTKRC